MKINATDVIRRAPIRLLAASAMLPLVFGSPRAQAQGYVSPDEPAMNVPDADSRDADNRDNKRLPPEFPVTSPNNDASFAGLLSGQAAPLSLRLNDLKSGWRRLTLNAPSASQDRPPGYPLPPPGRIDFDGQWLDIIGAAPNAYFSRGQTVTSGGDSFLLVYRVRYARRDMDALFRDQIRHHKPPTQEQATQLLTKFLRQIPLDLSLVNLKTVNNLSGIRPFEIEKQVSVLQKLIADAMQEMKSDKGESGTTIRVGEAPSGGVVVRHAFSDRNSASLFNLKQIGLGLMQYMQDSEDVLPTMTSAATAKKALLPYLKNESLFVQPGTNSPYLPNSILSRKKLAHIANPSRMIAFYEGKPASDGLRAVLFLDGHVQRLNKKQWQLFKRGSKIE